ncbi:MAG: UvrB/UvrC motif-containing protein [Endomicrobiia bacterium]|nr:UvrB/UvrC motif-containing protein [Endomicrobiia bacterium]
MLCQKCLKNEATVFIEASVNGSRWKCHVCARCASREVIISPAGGAPAASQNPASYVSKQKSSSARSSGRAYVGRGVCPVCGTSSKQIKKTSRFGCAACYEIFGAKILDSATSAAEPNPPAAEPNKRSAPAPDCGKPDDGNKVPAAAAAVKKLRDKLERAVRREDYEEAAGLRDKIKQYNQ